MPTRHNSRIYPRFLPQLEKIHETSHSARDEALPLHCVLSNSMFPIQHERRFHLLDGTPESPQEEPHKSRMTLMSPKECEMVQCNPNQIKMTPDSPVLDLVQSSIPQSYKTGSLSYFRQLQRFPVIPVSNLEEHQFLHRHSRKAPWTPY